MGQAKNRGNFIVRLKEAQQKKEIEEAVKAASEELLAKLAVEIAKKLLETGEQIQYVFRDGRIASIVSGKYDLQHDLTHGLAPFSFWKRTAIMCVVILILRKQGITAPHVGTNGYYSGTMTYNSKPETETKIVVVDESAKCTEEDFKVIENRLKIIRATLGVTAHLGG